MEEGAAKWIDGPAAEWGARQADELARNAVQYAVKGAASMKKKTTTTKPKARTSVKVKDLSPKKNPKAGRRTYKEQ